MPVADLCGDEAITRELFDFLAGVAKLTQSHGVRTRRM
jgi:hypothetical protein